MKKILFLILSCLLIFTSGCSTNNTGRANDKKVVDTIDEAIQLSSVEVGNSLQSGIKIAVLTFKSDSERLSSYVIEELNGYFVQGKKVKVVDRTSLELIRQEMKFQMSGEVSDESAQAIGKMLGAQTIISGEIIPFDKVYRLRVQAISVETAAIQGTLSRDIKNDNTVFRLTGLRKSSVFSAGGGFSSAYRFFTFESNHVLDGPLYAERYETIIKDKTSTLDVGVFGFFDLKFVELDLVFSHGFIWGRKDSDSYTYDKNGRPLGGSGNSDEIKGSRTGLEIGVLGKYPFNAGRFSFFPLLGLQYRIEIYEFDDVATMLEKDDEGNFRFGLWANAGGGMDYYLSPSLFIRGEFIWGYKIYDDLEGRFTDSKGENGYVTYSFLTHGPSIKIGIGFKL